MKNANDYWQNKISLWLHDPICKIFDIPNHETIAKEIAELLYQKKKKKEIYQSADMTASGMTRTVLPSHSEGGSIDFKSTTGAKITHPLVQKAVTVELPEIDISRLITEIRNLLTDDLGLNKEYADLQFLPEDQRPLNGFFDRSKTPEDWAQALFHYLFFAFKKRLRIENTGGLGCLWDILPADTRMPDHPLWHHLGMVSAIGSCLREDENISIVAFSITPVQDFIGKARKLRDYWSGSVLLSYLAFTGISHIMETLGPDHILYPSLHNQTMVNTRLEEKYHLGRLLSETDKTTDTLINDTKGIAAMPNKFVFLCPENKVKTICRKISDVIISEWKNQSDTVKRFLKKTTGSESSFFDRLWDTQIEDFWKLSWAAAKLADLNDKQSLESLLSENIIKNEYGILDSLSYDSVGKSAKMYASSHSLVQSLLAAGKTKPTSVRRAQSGEKCPLCGEREVLHNFEYSGTASANEYKKAVNTFWDQVRSGTNNTGEDDSRSYIQTGKTERLCAVCAVKRYLPVELKKRKDSSVLGEIFCSLGKTGFPSTTEIAAKDYLDALQNNGISFDRDRLIGEIHRLETETEDIFDESSFSKIRQQGESLGIRFSDKDKYYALLLMDGDKMGDLINGETLTATFRDILHPELANKIETDRIRSPLKKVLNKKRTVNPALHAMISDSLNNFARFGVQPAVKAAGGKLIYAGGDDVCAILPVSKALDCADKIRSSYRLSFAQYNADGAQETNRMAPSMNLLGYHLGGGAEKISLSGAVVIAHHKQPLREVIKEAHSVLDGIAKEKTGRNAIAVRLHKRSGGCRDWSCRWDSDAFKAFKTITQAVGESKISSTLLYKMQELETLFSPFLKTEQPEEKYIDALIRYELKHSGVKVSDEDLSILTHALKNIIFTRKENNFTEFTPDAAVIASFFGKTGDKQK